MDASGRVGVRTLSSMARALVAVGAALVLCFAILGAVVYFTRSEDTIAVDSGLAESITKAVAEAEQRGEPVDLSRLTSFPWDRVVVFVPRTPKAVVDKALGFEFKGDLPYDAESSEVFAFVDDGRLARFADYRGRGTFAGLERPVDELTPRQAVFDVHDLVARPRR
jgi:hypothetical protein